MSSSSAPTPSAPANWDVIPLRPAPTPRHANRSPDRAKAPDGAGAMVIVTYLRLYWMTILFCGGLLGAGLAYLAWNLIPSKFESYALLQVASSPTSIASANDPTRSRTDFTTYLKTTAQLIKSEFVLNSALNDTKYKITTLPTLAEQTDPIKYLDEKLIISYSDGSEVIRVSMEGNRPGDIRTIVDAVKDAYYREVVEKELLQKTAFKLKVEQAKTTLEGLMKTKVGSPLSVSETDLAKAAKPTTPTIMQAAPPLPGAAPVSIPDPALVQASSSTPASGAESSTIIVSDMVKRARMPLLIQKMAQLASEIDRYPLAIEERKIEIEALKKQMAELKSGPPSAEVLAAAERDPEVMLKMSEAEKLRNDYEYLAKVVNNPSAGKVQRLRQEADLAEAEANRLKMEKAKTYETDLRQKEADNLANALFESERGYRRLIEQQRISKKQYDDARKELSEIPPEPVREEIKDNGPIIDPIKSDLLTHDEMYRRITAQLIALDFELQSPPRVRKLQDASSPTQKDMKKQVLGTAFAGLVGFGLIGLIVVAVESRAKKVNSLTELKASTPASTPIVGVIPWNPQDHANRDPIRQSDISDSIDKLRATVSQSWIGRGCATIAVCSPFTDEGNAFTAFSLACSLARSGKRTLLVDFDLREPTLHLYGGVPNDLGVCEVLRAEADVADALMILPNGLHFIPAGNWSEEAREASVGGRLETLFARLREPFDCIILHGHALLTAAETVEIVRRSDLVLLTTLHRETRLPLLKRAQERLTAMEVPNSGLVYLGASPNEALC